MLDVSNPNSSANDLLCRQEAIVGWGCQLMVPMRDYVTLCSRNHKSPALKVLEAREPHK
jgi:hypothetical protein